MTDCPNGEVRDLLPDLLHDRLPSDTRREVEAHVRDCEDCRAELELLRAMRASLRRGPSVDVAAIAAAIPSYRAPVRRSWAGWRAAAAIMLLAAGGTSVAVLQRGSVVSRDTVRVSAAVPQPTTVATSTHASLPGSAAAAPPAPRELALGSSAIGDLSDVELSALLKDLQTVDVLPSADVDNTTGMSPVLPTGTE